MTAPNALPLPMRVKAFLTANPEEQLTALDISIKFATQYKNVHTQLARAVDSGELVRSRNEDGDYVYTAGKLQPLAVAAPKPAPVPPPAMKPRTQKTDVDLCSLPITSDIPIPPPGRRLKNHNATSALDRLVQPGQSMGVPLNANGINAIRKAITERHRAGTHSYVVRTLETEFRIWRKA